MPYQNPFAYYISALVYEENGEFNDAYIDIKQASKYYPDSKILEEKLRYYKKRLKGRTLSPKEELKFLLTSLTVR